MKIKTATLVLWSIFGLIFPVRAVAQISSELPCVAGSVDLLSATYNGLTQKLRSWICVDATGHVTSPVFSVAGSGVTSVFGRSGAVVAVKTDYSAVGNLTLGDGLGDSLTFGPTVNNIQLSTNGSGVITFTPTSLQLNDGTLTTVSSTSGVLTLNTNGTGQFQGNWNFATPPTGIFGGVLSGTGITQTGAATSFVLTPNAASGPLFWLVVPNGDSIQLGNSVTTSVSLVDAANDSLSIGSNVIQILNGNGDGIQTGTPLGTTIIYGNAGLTTLTMNATSSFSTQLQALTPATATNSGVVATTAYVVLKLATPTPIGSTTANTGKFTTLTSSLLATTTICASAASPAVCAAAPAGSVVIAATTSTVTVNTTAVTANSQILLTSDDSLSTRLSVTCNTTLATIVGGLAVTARTPGVSFQITSGVTPAVNPLCISYKMIN